MGLRFGILLKLTIMMILSKYLGNRMFDKEEIKYIVMIYCHVRKSHYHDRAVEDTPIINFAIYLLIATMIIWVLQIYRELKMYVWFPRMQTVKGWWIKNDVLLLRFMNTPEIPNLGWPRTIKPGICVIIKWNQSSITHYPLRIWTVLNIANCRDK